MAVKSKPATKDTKAPREPYVVTDAGGQRPDVGGRVRMVGDVVMLNPAEAEWELKRGIVITQGDADRRKAAAEKAAEPASPEPAKQD